jgi:hypothetical protein
MDPVVSRSGDGERFERENRTITVRVDLPGLSIFDAFDDTVITFHAPDAGFAEFVRGSQPS